MYKVVFIISPIDSIARIDKALHRHNEESGTISLQSLDIRVLAVLKDSRVGMQERPIMYEVRDRINRFTMQRTLTRLQQSGHVVRTLHKKRVFYSITLSGRGVLDDINARIIKLTEDAIKAQQGSDS